MDDFVQAAHLPSCLGFCANTQTSTSSVVCLVVLTSAIQDNAPADSSQTVAVTVSDDTCLLSDKHVMTVLSQLSQYSSC